MLGYTQSDEITLVFKGNGIPFDGRYQKLCSVLAGFASAVFAREAMELWPLKQIVPCFDCRVWEVPSEADAIDVLAWREADAVKNSVSMAARAFYSHKELHGKGQKEMHDLLHAKGVNWNDYPVHFKRGVYVKRITREVECGNDIPEKFRPPSGKVMRSFVEIFNVPPIRQAEAYLEDLMAKTVFRSTLPSIEMDAEDDVHANHCCWKHGCKYGDDDCAVTTGAHKQLCPCENCPPS